MKLFRLFLLLSVLIWACFSAKVVELDSTNFQKTIAENTMVFVDFYAPWCGHCKSLRPVLDKVAAQLTDNQIQCLVVTFDVSNEENEAFLQSEQIDLLGFPTLILYKYGQKLSEYTGNRVEQDILAFLKSKSLPVATRIESYTEIEPLISSLEYNKYKYASGKNSPGSINENVVSNKDNHFLAIVVGFFPPSSDTTSTANNSNLFMNIAMHFDLGLFFVTDNAELLAQFDIVEDSIVVFTSDKQHFKQRVIPFRNKTIYTECVSRIDSADVEAAVGQEKACHFSSLASEDSIKRQILLECLPTVIPYSQDTQPLISSLPTKEHVLLFFNKSVDSHVTFVDQVESIGRIHLSNLLCIEVDVSEYQLFSFFNIKMDDLPQLVIVDMSDESDMKKYALSPYLQVLHPSETPASPVTDKTTASTLNAKKPAPMVAVRTSPLVLAATQQEIEDFIDKYVAHQLERSLLSEDVAALASSNANFAATRVENIASMNFQEKVMDPSMDSLLYIHAPWCGHCKSIEPVISAVAKLHDKETDTLRVYRIDGTRNDINHPSIKVKGFPVIYFFKGGDLMNPIEYDGERTVQAIESFVNTFKRSAKNEEKDEQSVVEVEQVVESLPV